MFGDDARCGARRDVRKLTFVEVEQYYSFPSCGSDVGHRQAVCRRNAAARLNEQKCTSAVAPISMHVEHGAYPDGGCTRSTTPEEMHGLIAPEKRLTIALGMHWRGEY